MYHETPILLTIATMIYVMLLLCLLQLDTPKPVAPIDMNMYSLVWSDEFSAKELDSNKWMHRCKDGMHGKSRIRKHCTTVQDGIATLRTQLVPNESEVGYEIESGMIATQGIQCWTYGLFEARIKFESASGHHGAFWLQSEEYGIVTDDFTASGAEIDIIEYFGNKSASQNVHWNAYKSKDKKSVGSGRLQHQAVETIDSQFHVYSLLWIPEEYIFYIDGDETWRTKKAVSHHKEHIIFSILTSESEAGRLKPKEFPDAMELDWVRVYQRPH